jgi:hypothetical protein
LYSPDGREKFNIFKVPKVTKVKSELKLMKTLVILVHL